MAHRVGRTPEREGRCRADGSSRRQRLTASVRGRRALAEHFADRCAGDAARSLTSREQATVKRNALRERGLRVVTANLGFVDIFEEGHLVPLVVDGCRASRFSDARLRPDPGVRIAALFRRGGCKRIELRWAPGSRWGTATMWVAPEGDMGIGVGDSRGGVITRYDCDIRRSLHP